MATVKVAVRVRPLNQREIDMNATPIIEMEGKKTRICNSKVAASKLEGEASREKYKDFTFDYSYWSCDQNDDHFASQEQVFNDLGKDVLENAFQGYNACVFAYGQTGSGKTHTMMGASNPPESQGLIPRICQDMFRRMNAGKEKGTTYRTEVSYLEIYNERVKDLLKGNQTHSLKVREHPKAGPYVEGLSKHLVMDYADITALMNKGNNNRTTASTNMNDVSSRSHAIFTMTFVQATFVGDMPSETVSKVHLVDLAGSERADATGATGQRLKEGAHINKSLVTLGSVISALAEASQAAQQQGQKRPFIPYRDSVLTWLLKDSLGGNAKTIMIAAISPADCNYGETLSTLRYANRAKNIVNKPTINEDPNVKLIRDLRNEIQKLKTMLGSNDSGDVLEELQKKEAKEKSLTEEWTDKWKETQKILMEQKDLTLRKAGTGVVLDSQMPHLIGIDDDLHSTGITLYHLKEGETRIGSDDSNPVNSSPQDIMLKGQGLESSHCTIMLENGVATLVPNDGALCSVNGQPVDKPTRLFQGCVILLGRTNMFRYNDPAEAEKMRKEGSRSHLNLNRLSFLSRSASDLAWSESFASANGEESNVIEEKRKQLAAEEVRLQKESQALMEQKKLLEEQKQNYQQLQAEKEEAWKAEQLNKSSAIQLAQKELEERRKKLEAEYAAHRRRLAEDWKRLEQQEQETLANLQSKEKDLKRRRELLEWEIDQEMEQIETEAQKIESLRTELESKQAEAESFGKKLTDELQAKLGRSEEELKPILLMEELEFQKYLNEQSQSIDNWKSNTLEALLKQREVALDNMQDIRKKLDVCKNAAEKTMFEKECAELKEKASELDNRIQDTENTFSKQKQELDENRVVLKEYRSMLMDKRQECKLLEEEVEKGISKMVASEDKMSRLESDLALIADQEKSIVTQLAHIDSSKQKLKTIIENTADADFDALEERKKQLKLEIVEDGTSKSGQDSFYTACSTTSDNNSSNQLWNLTLNGSSLVGEDVLKDMNAKTSTPLGKNHPHISPYATRDSSPCRVDRKNDLNSLKSGDISPIKAADNLFAHKVISSPGPPVALSMNMTPSEITMELKRLVEQINDQKTIVLECLENDCDKEELNGHMAILQELRNRYLEIECLLDNASKRRWLGYEEDDSNFDFDKTEDSTVANDSELDESEALSSVTDQEDIQTIIDQEVEKRLKEIFEQLKQGQSPNVFLRQKNRRALQTSMPSGLNNFAGSDDDSSSSPNPVLPRSISMNSGIWSAFATDGVIPGVLDVTISSYVLRGNGSSTHYEYEVSIVTPLERWTVLRRYQRFRDLHSYMRKKYGPKVAKIPFPPKKFLGRRSEKLAKERQKLLETFLQNLLQTCSALPTCPLYNCTPQKVRDALTAFAPFFQKGFFESTIYGTS